MTADIEPLGEIELWNRPRAGEVAPWVRVVVAFACVLGVVLVAAGVAMLWKLDGRSTGIDKAWFRKAPPVYMVLALAAVFAPNASVSRFVRLAIALPVIHAISIIVAAILIPRYNMPALGEHVPMLSELSPVLVFLALLGITVGAGRYIAGRREWVHGVVMIALANLLLVGLWLPVVAGFWARPNSAGLVFASHDAAMKAVTDPGPLLAAVLVPPFVVACGYALLASRAPGLAARARNPILAGLILLFTLAVVARIRNHHGAYLIYDNFVHVVLALVMVAIVATATLAIATWVASRRSTRSLEQRARPGLARESRVRDGVIDDHGSQIVACLQITSWLRGPRMWTRGFIARVGDSELLVPGGARLATTVPLVSSVMRSGEAVVVLERGDGVKLGGFVDREIGEDPFRSTTVTVPGPSGVVIGTSHPTATPLQSMGMMAWRPSVAYLVIVAVIAIPAILGVTVPSSW